MAKDTITLTTETAANRYRVALPNLGTNEAFITGYIIECTAGAFDGRLYVTDGDPLAWAAAPLTASEYRIRTDVLSLGVGDSSAQMITDKPGQIHSSAGAYLVLEDSGGTGLAAFSGSIIVFHSVA